MTTIDRAKTIIVRLETLFKHSMPHETKDLFHQPPNTLLEQTQVF